MVNMHFVSDSIGIISWSKQEKEAESRVDSPWNWKITSSILIDRDIRSLDIVHELTRKVYRCSLAYWCFTVY